VCIYIYIKCRLISVFKINASTREIRVSLISAKKVIHSHGELITDCFRRLFSLLIREVLSSCSKRMSKQDGLAFPKALFSMHLRRHELRTFSWIYGKNPCGSTCRGGEGARGEGGGPKKIMVMMKNEKKKKDEEKAEAPDKSTGSSARPAGSPPTEHPIL